VVKNGHLFLLIGAFDHEQYCSSFVIQEKKLHSVFLIFPHQLFKALEPLKKADTIFLVEEELFFNQYAFHKQKLVFHRASMQTYFQQLVKKGLDVAYVEAGEKIASVKELIKDLNKKGVQRVEAYRMHDDWLERRILKATKASKIELIWHESTMFLLGEAEVKKELEGKKTFFQTSFYISQRKRFSILLEKDGSPAGGKWSFDADNRKPYPKNKKVPQLSQPKEDTVREHARNYVAKNYPNNPGNLQGPIIYPITHAEAEAWLEDFLQRRFEEFGLYEDAMVIGEHILHHSVLTPMLNVGLLTPDQVIDRVIAYAQQQDVPMNSLEGFVRQVVGWREFIRGIYDVVGRKQRTTNYWGFTRKIPESFYKGNTGIVPVDDAIQKLLQTGYNHHIERLMVLSNFMLLCEFDPDEVYRWFMEMYIDAYDWVMVPNVYGMGQFADGGLMCSKPYISGSNYVLKMSDYKKSGEWTAIWDALFWRFMHVHRDFFLSNPRLGMLVKTFDKMPEEKRNHHLTLAEKFLQQL
jgi:deoxyribodipyrimidine photolyase-related protein